MNATSMPRMTIPEPAWSPGPPATYELGEFVVGGAASVCTRGWLDGDLEEGDLGGDHVALRLRPGRWLGRLVIQPEALPETLDAELSRHPDGGFLRSAFEVIHRRPWLVLAHSDLRVGVPHAANCPSVSSLERAQCLAAVPFVVTPSAGEVVPLACVGRPEPWAHRVALVFDDELTVGARRSLRSASPGDLLTAWDWGLLLLCGRDGNLAVLAAGPESARSVVAIPGRV